MRISRQSIKVSINAFKSDGRCYRTFVGQLLHRDLELTIVYCPIGTKIINQGQVFIGDKNLKMYFWQNRNYNVMEFRDENNELEVLYANITSLPKIESDMIEYVDFELDILQRKGEEPKIIDEDEFREAAEKYNYSIQFQEACYQYCEQAIATIRQWQVGI